MLTILSYTQLVFLVLQLLFFIAEDKLEASVFLAFVLFLIVIILQIKLFKKAERKIYFLNVKSKSIYTYILVSIFLLLFLFAINGLSKMEPGLLIALQGTKNLGLLLKTGSVLLPAIAFTIYFTDTNKIIKFLIFVLALFASGYTSMILLSKMPLVPYVVFGLLLVYLRNIPRYYIILFLSVLLPLVANVYIERESVGEIAQIPKMIIFRLTMLPECSYIITWLDTNSPFGFHPLSEYGSLVTRAFGYDPRFIGIAPSFVGYFLIIFGYIGILFPFIFVFIIYFSLRLVNHETLFGKLFYFLWTLELSSFLTDGVPHFYLSTTGGKLFWGMLLIFIVMLFTKYLAKKFRKDRIEL